MPELLDDATDVADDQVASDEVLLGTGDDPETGDPGTPEPSPAAAPAAPAAPADPFASVFELSKELGHDLSRYNYRDGRSAIEGLINARKALAQRDPYSDIGKRVSEYADEFEEFLRTKRAPQRSEQHDPDAWELPTPLPQQIAAHLYRDEQGRVQLSENAPLEVRRAYEKHEQLRQEFARELTTNPRAVFDRLQQQFESRVLSRVEQVLAQREQHASHFHQQQQALGQIGDWAYQRDANGNVLRAWSDRHGTEVNVLTPLGQQYANEVEALMQRGIPDTTAHELAMRLIGGPPRPAERPAATAPVSPAGPRRQRAAAPHSDDTPQSLFEIALAAGEVSVND